MTNVEKLEENGWLEDIRGRLGDDKPSLIQDNTINNMSALEIVEAWSGWNLGSPEWATTIVGIYKLIDDKELDLSKTVDEAIELLKEINEAKQ